MGRIKEGDVFEIKTSKGIAYLHFIYKDETSGDLIRVLPGIYQDEPEDISSLIKADELFMVYFPLKFCFKKNIVDKIGFYDASSFNKPTFMRTEHNIGGNFLGWHIVNTETWQRELILDLNKEQKRLSPWGIWNDTLLVERIDSNWTLDN